MTVTDLVANFGDVIELRSPGFDLGLVQSTLATSEHWHPYNPRKVNARFGLSVTSLDGGYSGVPDLDSLREYNTIHGTKYRESSFTKRTSITKELGIDSFLDLWDPWLGRTHFLRLDAGGFFPPHRDNGLDIPARTMRVLVPIKWSKHRAVWLQENRPLHLEEGKAYFINTSKEHSLFSFQDQTTILVLNVQASQEAIQMVASNAHIL